MDIRKVNLGRKIIAHYKRLGFSLYTNSEKTFASLTNYDKDYSVTISSHGWITGLVSARKSLSKHTTVDLNMHNLALDGDVKGIIKLIDDFLLLNNAIKAVE